MNKSVPFFRPSIGDQEINEVIDTLRSGWLTSGKRVQTFERNFAEAVGAPYAVALNSCTAALHLAVEALGLQAGQKVLVPTMTFAATAEVVRYLGATPVLVDCDPVTLNMDLEDAARRITDSKFQITENSGPQTQADNSRFQIPENSGPQTQADNSRFQIQEIVGIIPVHVGGVMLDLDAVKRFAGQHGLWIVEDAAHAFPAAARKTIHHRDTEDTEDTEEIKTRSADYADYTEKERERTESKNQRTKNEDQSTEHSEQSRTQTEQSTTHKDESTKNKKQGTNEWIRCGELRDGERRVVCFSFYANKTITTGEGGMAVTGCEELATRMRLMSLHGLSQDAWTRYAQTEEEQWGNALTRKAESGEWQQGKAASNGASWDYQIIAPGFKYNLTDIAAAIGIHQLARAEEMRRERERIAHQYFKAFADLEEIEMPPDDPNRIHAWHLFPIRLRLEKLKIDRKQFMEELKRAGIGCSVHWRPLHLHPYYQQTFGYRPEDFPIATRVWQRLISLPIFPGMTADELDHVIKTVRGLCTVHMSRRSRPKSQSVRNKASLLSQKFA